MDDKKGASSGNESETNRLRDLIKRSGLPLEIEIANFLSSRVGWGVSTNASYIDRDTSEGREIDVLGAFRVEETINEELCYQYLKLLIECKKIPGNAWVFFKSASQVALPGPVRTTVFNAIPKGIHRGEQATILNFPGHIKNRPLHYERNGSIAGQCKEFVLERKMSNGRDDNLYKSIVSLAKATSFEVEQDIDYFAEEIYSECPPDWLSFIYPIIVFDGKVFLANKEVEEDNFPLTPAEHVLLTSKYLSGKYNMSFTIDVVRRSAFQTLFHEIEKDLEVFKEELRTDEMKEYRKRVREATQPFREKDWRFGQ